MHATLISVVIPLLNEEENLPRLFDRLCQVAQRLQPLQLEMVFVDDGSTDNSAKAIQALVTRNDRVRLIRLSRNFGSHAAIAAGFRHAAGDAITVMSADMQDPPELIVQMVAKWQEGYDTVWATRASREDGLKNRFFSQVYHRLIRRLALPQMPAGGVDVCLVSRAVIESMGRFNERNTSIFCLIMWAGFKQCFIPYHREARQVGRSKWTLAKQLKLVVDSFVGFSFFPIRLISYLGLGVSLVGFLYALYIIVARLLWGRMGEGWASLMVAIVTLAGMQMLMLGIVAEYLWRTFDESRKRPPYIVKELKGFERDGGK